MSGQFAQAYLGIGEVLVKLRTEFPDVSVSKIRFLESEGLISPARSPSGYRRFSPDDIARLRFILAAQRDHYLPLRVIRERLEHGQAGPGGRGPGDRPDDPGPQAGAGGRSEMVGRRDLLEAAGIDDEQLAELEDHGLIRRSGRLYGQDALDVACAVAGLARHGVQARNLRPVVTSAERDVALIEQLVAPVLRQRSPRAREQAGRTAREIAALVLRLRRALIESALAEAALPGGELPEPAAAPARRRPPAARAPAARDGRGRAGGASA